MLISISDPQYPLQFQANSHIQYPSQKSSSINIQLFPLKISIRKLMVKSIFAIMPRAILKHSQARHVLGATNPTGVESPYIRHSWPPYRQVDAEQACQKFSHPPHPPSYIQQVYIRDTFPNPKRKTDSQPHVVLNHNIVLGPRATAQHRAGLHWQSSIRTKRLVSDHFNADTCLGSEPEKPH